MNPTTTEISGPLPDDALHAFGAAVERAVAARYPEAPAAAPAFEAPRRPEFGDVATNVALQLAKVAKRSPQDVALALIEDVRAAAPELASLFASIDAVAGFINLRLAPHVWQTFDPPNARARRRFRQTAEQRPADFARVRQREPDRAARGRAGPHALDRRRARARVPHARVRRLRRMDHQRRRRADGYARALALRALPADRRTGIPVSGRRLSRRISRPDRRKRFANATATNGSRRPKASGSPYFKKFGRDELVAQQQRTAERFRVRYDLWQSEKELHDTGKIREGVDRLTELGTTYEKDGAVWFRATDFDDDKDRVVTRSDGRPTYFALDVTYHYQKLQRAGRVIDILGPDHHGYIGRLRGLAKALGFDPLALDVLISGQVALMRGGETMSMSKRAGDIVTLDEILDEVGNDAARFFFVMLSPESPLTFDLKLAVEKTAENPVYYVQYGHARIASILRRAGGDDEVAATTASLAPLVHETELALARRIAEFPRAIQAVVDHLAPHRLARYARDIAADFHAFYTECKVLDDNRAVRLARLALCLATMSVLANALHLLGVSAPDTM